MIRFRNITLCVALLAGATASYSDIVHTPTDFVVGDVWVPAPDELFELDVDSNGTVDFSLIAGMNYFSGISSSNPDVNKYLILPSPPPNIGGSVAALDSGYVISANSGEGTPEEWFGLEGWDTLIFLLSTGETGEFIDHRGYVGLAFEAEDGIHYGWLDIEGVETRSSIRIRGWAYESTPGVGIVAGAVPEPSSVILFMLGAIGTWTLRKRKNR